MNKTNLFNLLKFFFLVFLSLLIGYFLSIAVWNKILLPFSNSFNASGKLAQVQFNPVNNYLRFVSFIGFPIVIFIIFYSFLTIRKIIIETVDLLVNNFSSFSKDRDYINKNILKKILRYTLILIVLPSILIFIQKDFSTSEFDMFHEGEQITPAFNYINNKGLWTGTLFVHGAVYDLFTAFFGWKLFGITSIGAYRVMVDIFKLFIPLGLSFLVFSIWKYIKNKDLSMLMIQIMIFCYLISSRIHNFDRRNAPLLFGISFLILSLKNNNRLMFFLTGLFSALCSFYSLDVGLYFTALVLLIVPISSTIKIYNIKDLTRYYLSLLLGIVFGWVLFYAFFGHVEFMGFINNFAYFIKTKDLIDSYIYPFPSLISSVRFTMPLLILSINSLIFVILFLFVYIKGVFKEEGFIHGLFTLISLLYYRSALGRSDLTHIEYSSSFLILTFGLTLFFIFLMFFYNKKYLKKVILILFSINLILSFMPVIKYLNIKNATSFFYRLDKYVKEDSLSYINSDRVEGIKELRNIFSDEKCLFSLTSEPSIPYLLNKPSCGKIYISYFASADPVRGFLLDDLIKYKPKYLLYSSKSWTQNMDRVTNLQRFPNIMEYVDSNYSYYKTISDYWVVYSLNN